MPCRADLELAKFQSTPPRREATGVQWPGAVVVKVSIHAPPEGGDISLAPCRAPTLCFNPRPPEGGDSRSFAAKVSPVSFNPRPPGGRRPSRTRLLSSSSRFNPRPPGGRRPVNRPVSRSQAWFQSTPPRREATWSWRRSVPPARVSIHAPPEGGDARRTRPTLCESVSIHAPPEGGDGALVFEPAASRPEFQSTPPRREATL